MTQNSVQSLLLLFIDDQNHTYDLEIELQKERDYCESKDKMKFVTEDILVFAKTLDCQTLTWDKLISINNSYTSDLSSDQQVEMKLLSGFNQGLSEKAFMQ